MRGAWNSPLNAVMATLPAFAGHQAFLPFSDGHIVTVDLDRGVPGWSVAATPISAPTTGDGLLFVAESDAIVALRMDSGARVWRTAFTTTPTVPLVWDNGWLVATDASGGVVAIRATDGELIWHVDLGSPVHAPPALADDRVYVALDDARVVSLDVSTGTSQWNRRLGGPANSLLGLGGRVYAGSDDNYFYCLMASNGSVGWRWRTGADVIGQPVTDDHRIYFVSKDNVLRGLDLHSGAQRWQRPLPGRPTRGPARAGDLLLVSGLAPRIATFAMKDGTPSGDLTSPGELAGPPYVTDVRGLPQVILVARDISTGTRILAMRRTIDPPMDTPLPVLPGAITIAKAGTPGDPTATTPTPGADRGPAAPTPTSPASSSPPPASPATPPAAVPARRR